MLRVANSGWVSLTRFLNYSLCEAYLPSSVMYRARNSIRTMAFHSIVVISVTDHGLDVLRGNLVGKKRKSYKKRGKTASIEPSRQHRLWRGQSGQYPRTTIALFPLFDQLYRVADIQTHCSSAPTSPTLLSLNGNGGAAHPQLQVQISHPEKDGLTGKPHVIAKVGVPTHVLHIRDLPFGLSKPASHPQ